MPVPFVELADLSGARVIVPESSFVLYLDLEARGHVVSPHPDASDRISVSRGAALSADDRAALTAARFHLAALCRLVPPVPRVVELAGQ